MARINPRRLDPMAGLTGLELIAIVAILAILAVYVFDYLGAPDRVSISGPEKIPDGSTAIFRVTVGVDEASSVNRTYRIKVYEDDYFNDLLNDFVAVTITAGATEGSGPVELQCTLLGLVGRSGYSEIENPYDVFAIYDRMFPLTNIASQNIQTRCVSELPQ